MAAQKLAKNAVLVDRRVSYVKVNFPNLCQFYRIARLEKRRVQYEKSSYWFYYILLNFHAIRVNPPQAVFLLISFVL